MPFRHRQPKDRCATMVSAEILTILTMVVSGGVAGSKCAAGALHPIYRHTYIPANLHSNHCQDSQVIR